MTLYRALRPLVFRLDAERTHDFTLRLLALMGAISPLRSLLRRAFSLQDPALEVRAFGLRFANPLGLAAGYDKNGLAMHGLACLGFGHLELGTVTPEAQHGNPRPRLFRLPEDRALINRMGFPSEGALRLLRRLQRGRPEGVVVGVNLGAGANTPIEAAAQDYLAGLHAFYGAADYLAVNISSPNTVGLRRLQGREHLEGLLRALIGGRTEEEGKTGRRVPLLVKLSPDLTRAELEQAVGTLQAVGLDGVIATNTTVRRADLRSAGSGEIGGLSGAPLRERSTELVRRIHALTGGRLPIVGVGGILSPEDARQKLDAGATLVQIYTGLVYSGPGLVRQILSSLGRSRRMGPDSSPAAP